MSENNPIRVYVTHMFQESDDYLRVFEFLESMERFYYLNCSKPENVPESGGPDAVRDELIEQIKASEAVIVLASDYLEQPDITKFQISVAKANEIPLIAIRPFGGMLETPQELVEAADAHLEWNEREMVDSLKMLARLEDTARWETIEFTLD